MPLPQEQQQQQQQQPSPNTTAASNMMIAILVLAAIVALAASYYLIRKFLRRKTTPSPLPTHNSHPSRITPENETQETKHKNPLIETLPLFPFHSLSSSTTSATTPSPDCAICLSKFEQNDFLRLLPLCCHAFHQSCIDTWLDNNFTCPLCRSPVLFLDDDVDQHGLHSLSSSSRSFRIELGNVSRRERDVTPEIRRSYSLSDSFHYIVNDDYPHDVTQEISVPTSFSEFKVDDVENQQQHYGSLAAEVGRGGGGSWLKDYLSQSLSSASSRTASFRGSARWFFTGSGRRSVNNTNTTSLGGTGGGGDVDLEGRHFGEEIGELFRWLSGV